MGLERSQQGDLIRRRPQAAAPDPDPGPGHYWGFMDNGERGRTYGWGGGGI